LLGYGELPAVVDMPITSKYQIVVLEPEAPNRLTPLLRETLRLRINDLGIDPTDAVTFLTEANVADLDHGSPTVAVYFGGPAHTPLATAAVTALRQRGIFILPVVPQLAGYTTHVPAPLHEVNGTVIPPEDPALESIAQRLLEELRLVRTKRLVFISYRRTETRSVAEQLYRAFDDRSFDVFLDTHSIRSGLEFQSVLWDQMADADLLVLLDSPAALSSRWVREELARAHALCLGILQLVWPAHQRSPGTDFCVPFYLEPEHFDAHATALDDRSELTDAALHQIMTFGESLRARSLAARHSRLVGELCQRVSTAGWQIDIQRGHCIDLHPPGRRTTIRAFPLVGHPNSHQLHECFDGCGNPPKDGVVVYDPLGMLDKKASHLMWLNGYLPLRALPVTELGSWIRSDP
jgi:hypothetical protein